MDKLVEPNHQEKTVDALFFPKFRGDAAGDEICGKVQDAVGERKQQHGLGGPEDHNRAKAECDHVDGYMETEGINPLALIGRHPAGLQHEVGHPVQAEQHDELP